MHRKRHLAFPLSTADFGEDGITTRKCSSLKLQQSYFLNSLEMQKKEEDGVQKRHARSLREDVIGITSPPIEQGERRYPTRE
jgi:hypothetical protein